MVYDVFDPNELKEDEKPRMWYLGFEVPMFVEKKLRDHRDTRYPRDSRLQPVHVYEDGSLMHIPTYMYVMSDGTKIGYEWYEGAQPLTFTLGSKQPRNWRTILKVAAKYPPQDPNPGHTMLCRVWCKQYLANKKARHHNKKKPYDLSYFKK